MYRLVCRLRAGPALAAPAYMCLCLTSSEHVVNTDGCCLLRSNYVDGRNASHSNQHANHSRCLWLAAPCTVPPAGRTGAYVGSPELGPVNYFQTGEIRRPNSPLARDPWACRRLMDASLLILREVDPALADNKWAAISPDGQVGGFVLRERSGGHLSAHPTSRPLHTFVHNQLVNTPPHTHTHLHSLR